MHTLYATNSLIPHMSRMIDTLDNYDFRWIQNTDINWAFQKTIPPERVKAMMACLLHFNLDVSLLFRYLGGNYTGAYRDVIATPRILRRHNIGEDLIRHYVRIMTVGCPNTFNANIT